MSQYECKLCSYSTKDQSNFIKHKKSIKHTRKETESAKRNIEEHERNLKGTEKNFEEPTEPDKKLHVCKFCNKNYSTTGSLARHKKICLNKNNEQETKIKELEQKYKDQENQYLKEIIKKLEDDKNYYKSLVEKAGMLADKSISALTYIAKNYNNAPVIEQTHNYSHITYDDGNDEHNITHILFTEYENKTLCKYLGDIIVKVYKKDDPAKQSLWSSDTTRLTYIIRELINKNVEWLKDKGGIKTTKYIIDPLMEYLLKLLFRHAKDNRLEKHLDDKTYKLKIRMNELDNNAMLQAEIKNKTLQPSILKYIAPYFQLTKIEAITEK